MGGLKRKGTTMKKIISDIESRFPGYRAIGMVPRMKYVEFHLRPEQKRLCPACGKEGVAVNKRVRAIHDIPQNGFPVVLKFETAEYKCEGCGVYTASVSECGEKDMAVQEKSSASLKAWIKQKHSTGNMECDKIADACGLSADAVLAIVRTGG